MLDRIATEAVVGWFNHLLVREAWAREALAPYAGRVARFETGMAALDLGVAADGSLLAADARGAAPSVTITLEPGRLPRALLEPSVLLRDVRMAGDLEFAQALTRVLQNLKPDPAEDLSRWIGDAAAERVVGAARTAVETARDAGRRLARQATDYWVSENPILVGRTDLEQFGADVGALRAAVDRLSERVAKLS
ncbi:MAG TPA: SCP2 sterol-binding domain-containing protein [Burkholderiaceae bacterium]